MNFTGITFLTDEMAAKRMEFLKEVAPNSKRVAVIFNPQHFDDEVTFARRGSRIPWHRANNPSDKQRRRSRCRAARGERGRRR